MGHLDFKIDQCILRVFRFTSPLTTNWLATTLPKRAGKVAKIKIAISVRELSMGIKSN